MSSIYLHQSIGTVSSSPHPQFRQSGFPISSLHSNYCRITSKDSIVSNHMQQLVLIFHRYPKWWHSLIMSEFEVYCNLRSALAVLQQMLKLTASTENISKMAISFDHPASRTKRHRDHLK